MIQPPRFMDQYQTTKPDRWYVRGGEMLEAKSLGELEDIASQIEDHPQEMTQRLLDFCKQWRPLEV